MLLHNKFRFPGHQDNRKRLRANNNTGCGLNLAIVLWCQLECEGFQEIGQKREQLHLGNFLSWTLSLANSEGNESFPLADEVAIGVQPVFRAELVWLLPVCWIVMNVMKVWEDKGTLWNNEAIDLNIS